MSLRVELSARREVCEDCTPTFKSRWANEGCEVVKTVEVQDKTGPGRCLGGQWVDDGWMNGWMNEWMNR